MCGELLVEGVLDQRLALLVSLGDQIDGNVVLLHDVLGFVESRPDDLCVGQARQSKLARQLQGPLPTGMKMRHTLCRPRVRHPGRPPGTP